MAIQSGQGLALRLPADSAVHDNVCSSVADCYSLSIAGHGDANEVVEMRLFFHAARPFITDH
ncbi:hypothetical protein [Noviherbaspirillum soli]|uniref:hypothetical protein n=1 Tax=Noviherbaspirillum soli TaxID=1064518 RepID=UPI00188D4CB3|nr:hypothetical protein [Noviherbaspirillum soli]